MNKTDGPPLWMKIFLTVASIALFTSLLAFVCALLWAATLHLIGVR